MANRQSLEKEPQGTNRTASGFDPALPLTTKPSAPTPCEVRRQLQAQIPASWRLHLEECECVPGRGPDAVLDLEAPDGRRIAILVKIKSRLDSAAVPHMCERMRSWSAWLPLDRPTAAYLMAAPYLSKSTREKLRASALNYLDTTGNILLSIEEPGIYVRTQGADKNPNPSSRPAQSLRGAKVAQVVRALVDFRPPLGVRQVAQIAQADPGNVSRLIDLLERENLVRRTPEGGVGTVRWDELLQVWAKDYSLSESNRVYTYLNPRGLDEFLKRLLTLDPKMDYALTSSLAAAHWAPVAPARLAVAFFRDAPAAAIALDLVPTDTRTNVLLIEPKGDFPFERTVKNGGLTYVAPSQAVADLLAGPGRNPREAEAFLDWMRNNEDAWRTRP